MGGGGAEVLDDQAVGEEEDAVGDRGRARVVRDHDGRLAVARDDSRAARGSVELVRRVEVAGRLVGEHHGRLRDESARDCDTLLLAARRAGRTVAAPIGEPDLGVSSSTQSLSASGPPSDSGSTMFSSAVSIGSRLKNWKMKPMCSRRSFVSSCRRGLDLRAGDPDRRRRSAGRGRRGCA